MLLRKDELLNLARASEQDEVHQSRLFDYKWMGYDYRLFHKKYAFKIDWWWSVIIISTNEDRDPVYRLVIPCLKFKELAEIAHKKDWTDSEYIKILFKDNKAFWVCWDKDLLPISEYLTVLQS